MNNFDENVFAFGNGTNNDLEQSDNFSYDSLSGLGESNYENEDLFKVDDDVKTNEPIVSEFNFNNLQNDQNFTSIPYEYNFTYDNLNNLSNESVNDNFGMNFDPMTGEPINKNVNDIFWNMSVQPQEDLFVNNTLEQTNTDVNLNENNLESVFSGMQPTEFVDEKENNIAEVNNDELVKNGSEEYNLGNNQNESQFDEINGIEDFIIDPQDLQSDLVTDEEDESNPADDGEQGRVEHNTNNTFDEIIEESKEMEDSLAQNFDDSYMNDELKIEELEETLDNSQEIVEEQPIIENEKEDSFVENFDSDYKFDEFIVPNSVTDYEDEEDEISISETPIEELKELTKYDNEYIEQTDINELFNKVSVNVKDASDIFRKNTDMKAKIDSRFDELKKLQSEVEGSKQKQLDEINKYKEEVLEKLTEKKEEIEKRLNVLKEYQANLEKEKIEFEKYKKSEQENIEKVQKEVQAAYDDRREELNSIEDKLRRQKDSLDEERNQLSLDRIQYEADKNELANNLLKFNELVNSFTTGVNSAGRE